jgi:hypothetical protein
MKDSIRKRVRDGHRLALPSGVRTGLFALTLSVGTFGGCAENDPSGGGPAAGSAGRAGSAGSAGSAGASSGGAGAMGAEHACALLTPAEWQNVTGTSEVTETPRAPQTDGSMCDYASQAGPLGTVRIIDDPARFEQARTAQSETITGILNDAYWSPADEMIVVRGNTRLFAIQMNIAATNPRASAEALASLAAPRL